MSTSKRVLREGGRVATRLPGASSGKALLVLSFLSGVSCSSNTNTGSAICTGTENPPGPVVDLPWPAAVNTGHLAAPGSTVRFHWSGLHNVLQVATFGGQVAPLGMLSDAGWAGEIHSGAKQLDGSFDWNTGTFPVRVPPWDLLLRR